MGRKIRLEYPGACYLVSNKTREGTAPFFAPASAHAFEHVLVETASACGWRIHACRVLPDAFFAVIELALPNLSTGMKRWQGSWANAFYRPSGDGPIFRARFRALHIEPGEALDNIVRQVSALSAPPATSEEAPPLPARGWCIGSAAFRESLLRRMAEDGGGRTDPVPDEWEQRLQELARRAGLAESLVRATLSVPQKNLLLAAMRQTSAASNAWLARRLDLGAPSGISHRARRFLLRSEENRSRLGALVGGHASQVSPVLPLAGTPTAAEAEEDFDLALHD